MSELKTIKASEIVQLPEIQIRVSISKKKVDEYAEAMRDGVEFPPLDVFKDMEGRFLLCDGFHRFMATQQNGYEKVRIAIHACEPDQAVSQALELSLRQNCAHGLSMSRADRRNAVARALADKRLRRLGDLPLSKIIGVSPSLVKEVRREGTEKPKDVPVSSHKRKAPESHESDTPETDPLTERVETLRGWVASGFIEWKDIVGLFTSTTHTPVLVPKDLSAVILNRDGKRTTIPIVSMMLGKTDKANVAIFDVATKDALAAQV